MLQNLRQGWGGLAAGLVAGLAAGLAAELVEAREVRPTQPPTALPFTGQGRRLGYERGNRKTLS